MHDSCVFRISRIGQSVNPNVRTPPIIPPGTFLVGDAGYPGNMDILLPYPSVATPQNEWYNFIQSSTRIVVEQAFGRLKNRFRILLHAQDSSPGRARNDSFACMDWDARTPQERRLGQNIPRSLEAEDITLNATNKNSVAGGTKVPMWKKRDVIRDMLYRP
ncbi:hypothetical protein Pst134EA_020936 [Puccinia striiformis f. sp. tritici]|uniref:hypothetical protein n=1 Tax=Puccinia striiformis f. sp. tritici TaxID=168172 RepID=UPI002007A733|nr:hypothetical protein Pst134EA_020936 [Puccinia striiformis f. sp. tritici]KAH9457036.1 hypothetical protein Pst134EA_020936 [Puccinia striiformis f. sp. tritici]